MRGIVLSLIVFIFVFNGTRAYSGTVTMPSTLTADTSSFVLLSSSGTTPSISGYTGTLLVSAVASDGNVKITITSNLLRAAGYCGYSSDASSEPTSCSGSSLTEVGFRGTQDDINTALATLSFKGDGTAGSPTITVSVTPAGTNYYSGNGHYYEVVNETVTWTAAKAAAEASTLYGLTGYLVTITSAAENTFVSSKISANAWMGASDDGNYTSNTHATTEGTWEWVSGPENGKTFTCQPEGQGRDAVAAHSDCAVHSDTSYENWATNEPNDWPDEDPAQEDYGHIRSGGAWNDFKNDQEVEFYIVEYGGMPGESATTTAVTTLTINSTDASGSTYDAFDDKQVKGMANAQTEHAKRYMFNSTNQIMRRMEQFRRTGVHKSTGLRDLRLALNNNQRSKDQDVTSDLLDYYVKEYMSNNGGGGKDFDLKINNWAFWSAGSLSYGRLNLSANGDLGTQNKAEGFILGADINYGDKSLFGISLRYEDDQTNIGDDGTSFDAWSNNLSLYNTWQGSEKNYIDAVLSFGESTYGTDRVIDTSNPSNRVSGEFNARQIFGSAKYNFKNNFKLLRFHNYSRFDLAYVNFDEYTENGSSSSRLVFDSRDFETSSISLGSAVESEINLSKSLFIPYLKLDYNKDLTDSSTINAHFVGETKNYSTTINKNFSSMNIVETGFDLIFEDGWNIKTVFSRIDKNGLGHENNFEIRAVKNK